jgi:hypothetical protein
MKFGDLKTDLLDQVGELLRVHKDQNEAIAYNAALILATISLADYYQVYYAFKYGKWSDCGFHKIAVSLGRYEKSWQKSKEVKAKLIKELDKLINKRCKLAHGSYNLMSEDINIDFIESMRVLLSNLITDDILEKEIFLNVQGYADGRID